MRFRTRTDSFSIFLSLVLVEEIQTIVLPGGWISTEVLLGALRPDDISTRDLSIKARDLCHLCHIVLVVPDD